MAPLSVFAALTEEHPTLPSLNKPLRKWMSSLGVSLGYVVIYLSFSLPVIPAMARIQQGNRVLISGQSSPTRHSREAGPRGNGERE